MVTLLAEGVKVSWPMNPYESRSSPSDPTPSPLTAPQPVAGQAPTPLNCSVVPMPLPQYPEPVSENAELPNRNPPPAPTAVLETSANGSLAFWAVPLIHPWKLPLLYVPSASTRG